MCVLQIMNGTNSTDFLDPVLFSYEKMFEL